MDSEYDRKFEEMKKYIPFLESMIKRLENTSGGQGSANPRQAQLDKIRSLRDLLLVKKKRMKMDNLLKCEQVLINLYAKVEQRDTLPGIQPVSEAFKSGTSKTKEANSLSSVRDKLKSITSKTIEDDTLPEIARASEIEEVCTPGSKEPALFQRRPNKATKSPTRHKNSPEKPVAKRNYTRVLVSPEPSPRRWSTHEGSPDKPLFCRRSPRKSPKRHSPSFKKGKKKSSKETHKKDLNITINVPQESLESLNTGGGDILSRIINCDDNDVDIATLRDLRSQILGELKQQTGASEDISDIIMKSYKTKKKKNKLFMKNNEVEEGELSDSESEAIKSIYGSLVVVDKDQTPPTLTGTKSSTENDNQSRKIQLCLVINSDKEAITKEVPTAVNLDSDFEMFDDDIAIKKSNENIKIPVQSQKTENVHGHMKRLNITEKGNNSNSVQNVITIDDDDVSSKVGKPVKTNKPEKGNRDSDSSLIDISSNSEDENSLDQDKVHLKETTQFKANFYKAWSDETSLANETENMSDEKVRNSIIEMLGEAQNNSSDALVQPVKSPINTDNIIKQPASTLPESTVSSAISKVKEVTSTNSKQSTESSPVPKSTENETEISAQKDKQGSAHKKIDLIDSQQTKKDEVEIPLLNTEPVVPAPVKQNAVSEIDILQALKNDILSESIAIPGTGGSTPPLHQPKVTKVASAQEIVTKKRISIENYKQKSDLSTKKPLFHRKSASRNDLYAKKQSLKLTEQECERFNFPSKLALEDSSDEENNDENNFLDDVYSDLAPKSPDNEEILSSSTSTPIIIPFDPVKSTIANTKTDVDMRTLHPLLSPTSGRPLPVPPPASSIPLRKESSQDELRSDKMPEQNKKPLLADPRVRRDLIRHVSKDSPNPHTFINYPNMTPNLTPSRAPNMTPNTRSFETNQSVTDFEGSRKHVYAPLLSNDTCDLKEISANKESTKLQWDSNSDLTSDNRKSKFDHSEERDRYISRSKWEERDRSSKKWDDKDSSRSSIHRENIDYHKPRYDPVDRYQNQRSDRYRDWDQRDDFYIRQECPQTPVHPFGRSDCPATPNPSFGRHEAPMTPIHSFGRSDCPLTPSHPFGRSECPPTPSHPFGRSECPPTPSHPFSRTECPSTPSHPFGRADCPPTASHSFGRSDCPTTPSHSFGRSDHPTTPSHPFGRSDCPTTPSHPFGRSECSPALSHSFGRSDALLTPSHSFGHNDMSIAPMTPSHPFGRSDYKQSQPRNQKFIKDPRLNRSSDYDDKDRRKSDVPNRQYNAPDSYRHYNREQSVGNSERNKPFEHRHHRELTPYRESSVGRSLSTDYKGERLYTGERGHVRGNEKPHQNEKYSNDDTRKSFQRASSVGRYDGCQRSSSRTPSVNRNYQVNNDNTLSVKPQSGRSFIIDTSVNRTFQEFLNEKGLQKYESTFESRRQRAASVGRSLVREPSVERFRRENSVGRTLSKPSPGSHDTLDYKKMVNFVRARSMGREIIDRKSVKSLKEIKADFESYSARYDKKEKNRKRNERYNSNDKRSRKDVYQSQQASKPTGGAKNVYSPRFNHRDPRMRREQQNYDNRNRYEHKRNTYGIVYSNDNIAKGTILGSGFGVKNYKIPKIKRPVEENEVKEELNVTEKKEKGNIDKEKELDKKMNEQSEKKLKENDKKSMASVKTTEKKGKDLKGGIINKKQDKVKKIKVDEEKATKKVNVGEDNNKKRPTQEVKARRPSIAEDQVTIHSDKQTYEESKISKVSSGHKTRKAKKAVIESDSDSEEIKSDIKNKEDDKTKEKEVNDDDPLLDTTLGMNDFVFPGNTETAEVMANINELIANLDNVLDGEKTEHNQFTTELSLENMLENINSPGVVNVKDTNVEESFRDISDLIDEDLKDTKSPAEDTKSPAVICKNNQLFDKSLESTATKVHDPEANANLTIQPDVTVALHDSNQKSQETVHLEATENVSAETKENVTIVNENCHLNKDAVVSTTETVDKQEKINDSLEEKMHDQSSTPDSTINAVETVSNQLQQQEGMPDSTNEMQTDISDITSTHDTLSKDSIEASSLNKDTTPAIDSIGNILSILQNKSKIQELLTMLGSQSSDNERIKKKLEKLSELVSDEEDTKDEMDHNESGETSYENKEASHENKNKEASHENENKEARHENENKEASSENENKEASHENNLLGPDENLSENNIGDRSEVQEAVDKDSFNNLLEKSSSLDTVTKEENEDQKEESSEVLIKPRIGKKPGRKPKQKAEKKIISTKGKRITRAGTAIKANKPKASRELKQLQEDIKDMFISHDILNATGIRMCRLAKLVGEKQEEENTVEPKPVVVLQKCKTSELIEDKGVKIKRKPGPKSKVKITAKNDYSDIEDKTESMKMPAAKRKPGPKSKTKQAVQEDANLFENDSNSDFNTPQPSEDMQNSTDSENESLASSKSFGSSEVLADIKKKKRKRRGGWSSGVINKRKKKTETKQKEYLDDNDVAPEAQLLQRKAALPDMTCFTDKTYCFLKNVSVYPCRLCEFSGSDIVHHYKRNHPHSEIPLSKLSSSVAREAIEQCEQIDFQAMSKMSTDKYVCRFCFKEFAEKKAVLETFFWHVISTHTGEYKQLCSECINVVPCPFKLDIPPPPKVVEGQLIGYICGKCNFTQISLENLKIHVIVRHNDEQTEVYTINLAIMTKKTIDALMKHEVSERRVLRSRGNQSCTEVGDDRSDDHSEITEESSTGEPIRKEPKAMEKRTPKIGVHSKLTFENDDIEFLKDNVVKVEKDDAENRDDTSSAAKAAAEEENTNLPVSDILDCPHFKIIYNETGAKEYVCCIKGNDNHYRTALLISMKKHVQTKHSETWDGYCFVCKVIVMPQGLHSYRDCLQHMLDKHMDNFPVLERLQPEHIPDVPILPPVQETIDTPDKTSAEEQPPIKPYINVRPLSDLLSKSIDPPVQEDSVALPKIQSVVSLGPPTIETSLPDPSQRIETVPTVTPVLSRTQQKTVKYEETQAEIMVRKHRVVLDAMLVPMKVIQIFKCAGRYCSFTTDSAEAALVHASTHERIGGENALLCTYCDTDCKGNAIDLITHVFKNHGRCQYACGHCFYRAAASQLVRAHMARVHSDIVNRWTVFKSSVAVNSEEDKGGLLPRSEAVDYYSCAEASCKFRTYIHGKFTEHLMKHSPPYSCYYCGISLSDSCEVIEHLKSHGLKLYQCTWCVHGAENEGELLAHSSHEHPSKLPQAYLRVITMKDGDPTKQMVLPLAQLNKTSFGINLQSVQPNNKTEDPVREAERSIDLEKLIGSVSLPTTDTTLTPTTMTNINENVIESTPPFDESNDPGFLDHSTLDIATLIPEPPRVITPAPIVQISSQPSTPALKTEPVDDTSSKINESSLDVICLDTDDEEDSRDSGRNIINLSDDDNSTPKEKPEAEKIYEKFGPLSLYKCPKCTYTYKTAPAFKRHANICMLEMTEYICAHCKLLKNSLEELTSHYTADHGNFPKLRSKKENKQNYICGICGRKDGSLFYIKGHLKNFHGVANVIVSSKYTESGEIQYTVRESTASKPKRKLSANSTEQTPPKRKRYGPHDLDEVKTKKPILDEPAFCAECEFSTKVVSNLVRHLQQHADAQTVPSSVPVNPVPHLETNEKHFDKMINLASSSLVSNKTDKPNRSDSAPSVSVCIPPEAAARYPKYVPERQRHTCGAKDCSYISVDEAMLKCHWETLHAGSNNFHCVHCPPYQHLDTSRPLTAARIIAHLKMHDVRLYACSSCSYYHYKRQVLEKHLSEVHKGSGKVLIVREEATNLPTVGTTQPPPAAPTMDLKPWQCGLCKYKNMLRQEVIEHCSKMHNSKWQFKCPNCPFRGSTIENVSNHRSRVHPGSTEDVFYFYYREGSLPDESDGIPRWQKQRQKMRPETDVKEECPGTSDTSTAVVTSVVVPPPRAVDLNIVKKEIADPDVEESIEDLCKRFGEFCEPNGLKYKCPLCKIVVEDTKDLMQSHLYEELQYRKWSCNICCYKAFHKTGLHDHMSTEHSLRQNVAEPVELPIDVNIEKWVTKLLQYQTEAIAKHKENLEKQKTLIAKPNPPSSGASTQIVQENENLTDEEIEKFKEAFGPLGSPSDAKFCCPKCNFMNCEESFMKNHLELELNKIRWRCSSCNNFSQNYHEAQLHCKTCKKNQKQGARPVEAVRDPLIRAGWVNAVINTQKRSMNISPDQGNQPASDDPSALFGSIENSLLAVRYEERVPTPEEEMLKRKNGAAPSTSEALSAPNSLDSDDERLVIDEPSTDESDTPKKKTPSSKCKYCEFTSKYKKVIYDHTLRHYNLKPFTCTYCGYNCHKSTILHHNSARHPGLPEKFTKTKMPSGPPAVFNLTTTKRRLTTDESKEENVKPKDDGPKVICLVCEKAVAETEKASHVHDKVSVVTFVKKGDVVVKCCICLALVLDANAMHDHQIANHPETPINYAYHRIYHDTREFHYCGHCKKRFKFLRDLRAHHNTLHSSLPFRYESKPFTPGSNFDNDEERVGCKKKSDNDSILPCPKRVARKSTTKLPRQTVAKKSTTKLPIFYAETDSESDDEYSYYGTKPTPLQKYENVTTVMSFCNTMMPFTVKKLSEIIKLSPKVVVTDVRK